MGLVQRVAELLVKKFEDATLFDLSGCFFFGTVFFVYLTVMVIILL